MNEVITEEQKTDIVDDFFRGLGKPVEPAPTDQSGTEGGEKNQLEAVASDATQEIVPTPEELLASLNEVVQDPHQFSFAQVEELVRNTLAGRTMETFNAEEQVEHPELVAAFDQVLELIKLSTSRQTANVRYLTQLAAQSANSDMTAEQQTALSAILANADIDEISADQITAIQQVKDGQEVTLQVDTPDGPKTWTTTQVLVLVALVAFDLALFKGQFVELATGGLEAITQLLRIFGADVPMLYPKMYEDLIGHMNTRDLQEFIMSREGWELKQFLDGIQDDTLRKMLTGKNFGGVFDSKHNGLEGRVIDKLSAEVEPSRLQKLGVQSRAKTTVTA